VSKEYIRGYNAGIRAAAKVAKSHEMDFRSIAADIKREPLKRWTSKLAKEGFLRELAGIVIESHCIRRGIERFLK
jgi:hypothetical protein